MMPNDMPGHWDKFITALLSPAVTRQSMEAARKKYGVGNDFIQALRRLDAVRYFNHDGKQYPYLIVSPTVEQIRREMKKGIALRKSRKAVAEKKAALEEEMNHPENVCHTVGSTMENWKRSLQERGFWAGSEPERNAAPTLAEKTYTKQEVIDRFRAFYVREYDKMDDRAYTLCGFLLESLEEAI